MKPLRSSILVLVFLCFYFSAVEAQWTQVNTGMTNMDVRALAISGTKLFAAGIGGIFRSTDNGASWDSVHVVSTYALAVSGANLFAGTDYFGGVFLSTNNGTSWTQVNAGLTGRAVLSLAVSGTYLFAGTEGGGVFLSTNNGTSWTKVNIVSTYANVSALAVVGTNLFAGTYGGGVFLSTNNGASWTAVNTGLSNTNVQSLAVRGSNLFAGTDDGVFLSTNNGTDWIVFNTGLTNTVVQSLAVSGTNLFVGGQKTLGNIGCVLFFTNNGTDWTTINTNLTNIWYVRSLAITGTYLFAGTNSGVFRRSLTDWMLSLTPAYGIGGITPPTAFKWKANPQALAYAFQISTDAGFSNLVVNQYTTDTTYTVSNLQLTTAYYWRVRAENATWASEWGYGSFTTKMTSTPQLTGPVSAATLVSVTPTLSWSPVVSTATYTLQLSTQPAFDALVYSKDTTSTSIVLPQLQRLTTYYWRLRARTVGDTTAWSSVSSFSTVPNAPNKITLVYPDSGKQDTYRNDWFTWQGDNTATTYLIQISQSPLFASIFDSATVKSAAYRNANPVFTSGLTYFWRVRGSNTGGDAPFSSVWSFRAGSVFRMPATSYSTSTFTFGEVKIGQFTDTTVTISNTGNDTLKITSISSSNAAFSVRPTNKSVPPGQSFSDTIRYTPSVIGAASGRILIASNTVRSSDTVNVSGTGVGVTISGIVRYGSATGSPIQGVTITLASLPQGSQIVSTSDSSGTYRFAPVLPGSYSLAATKVGGFPAAFVNAADALKASLYSVDPVTYVLSPNQILAADVNNDANVNSADALQMMLRYVGSISSFAKGDWVFSPSSSTVTITNQNVTLDVSGRAVGDVNGDAQPNGTYFGNETAGAIQAKKTALVK
jgi:hypothetical protein